ncbi:flagellar biosynthetic protein FliR [Pseudooceanicola aestuarii]|uniref:flagellar biosynthetic protein FliR n=1 Tax=Pseudooceanicola aestuarii TaxID=2697319 RepID=UPI0013D354C2|nr:flagellar biosynthetic protein FliR [Pseudooceanicola aestuarii]
MDLTALLTAEFMTAALVFARIGALVMFMPGFGETFIPVRHRLAMALVLSLALRPAVAPAPLVLDDFPALVASFAIEITIGLWIGITARILLTALQFAGYQVGLIAGLSNAFAPEMGSFQGSTLISTGLMLAGVALIFAMDLHHVIIGAMALSYDVFPRGQLMSQDLSHQILRAVGQSFYMGMSIAAPFYVMGLLLNLGLGLANRMMPNLPVFFVAAPVLIFSGLLVLVVSAPMMLRQFTEGFSDWLGLLVF